MPRGKRSSSNINKDTAKEMGRRGGIASGKARVAKRKKKDALEFIMSLNPPPETYDHLKKFYGLENENMTLLELMWLGQIDRAITGDAKCARNVADYSGTKPSEKTELTADVQCSVDPLDDVVNALGLNNAKTKTRSVAKDTVSDSADSDVKEDE